MAYHNVLVRGFMAGTSNATYRACARVLPGIVDDTKAMAIAFVEHKGGWEGRTPVFIPQKVFTYASKKDRELAIAKAAKAMAREQSVWNPANWFRSFAF